jgi:hypothetical protein
LKITWARRGVVAFFFLFVLAVTWPGMLPFNRIEPLIVGLPFSMAWIAAWVILAFLALSLLDRAEGKERAGSGPSSGARTGNRGPAGSEIRPRTENPGQPTTDEGNA